MHSGVLLEEAEQMQREKLHLLVPSRLGCAGALGLTYDWQPFVLIEFAR